MSPQKDERKHSGSLTQAGKQTCAGLILSSNETHAEDGTVITYDGAGRRRAC